MHKDAAAKALKRVGVPIKWFNIQVGEFVGKNNKQ
jgi:hypothetical protein